VDKREVTRAAWRDVSSDGSHRPRASALDTCSDRTGRPGSRLIPGVNDSGRRFFSITTKISRRDPRPYLYCRQREITDALVDLGPVHQLGQLTRSIVEHLAGKPARCSPSGPGWRPAGGSARDATSVAQVQADLGVGWGTVMRAVREYATSAYW